MQQVNVVRKAETIDDLYGKFEPVEVKLKALFRKLNPTQRDMVMRYIRRGTFCLCEPLPDISKIPGKAEAIRRAQNARPAPKAIYTQNPLFFQWGGRTVPTGSCGCGMRKVAKRWRKRTT